METPVVSAQADSSFSLDQPGQVWLIRSGHLDLFLADLENGAPAGARWPMLRAMAGDIVCGIDGNSQDIVLLARAAPGTSVEQTSQDFLLSTPEGMAKVEHWIERVGQVFADLPMPKQHLMLEPGRQVTVDEQPSAATAASRVAWVRQVHGVSHLIGEWPVAVDDQDYYFPVSRSGWIMMESGSVLDVFDSVQPREASEGLSRFNEAALRALLARREREEDFQERRLAAKMEYALTAFEGSLNVLRAPHDGSAETPRALKGAAPVVRACEMAAGWLGLTVKAPPELPEGLRSGVIAIARISGLRVRQVVLRDEWWREDGAPMVAFRNGNPVPVALLPAKGGYRMCDPVLNTTVKATRENAAQLSGIAYLFYRPFPNERLNLIRLIAFGLRGCRYDLGMVLAMGLAMGLLGLVPPLATGLLFDNVIPSAQRENLAILGGVLLVTAISSMLFSIVSGFAVLRIEGKIASSLQTALWDRLLNLPVAFFRQYTSGDLAGRSMAIERIRQTLTGALLTSVLYALFSSFQLILLFSYNPVMAITAVALLAASFMAATVCGWLQLRYQRQVTRTQGRISGIVSQLINGITKIRVAGAEMHAFAHWAHHFAQRNRAMLKARKVANVLTVFNTAFPVASLALVYWVGVHRMEAPGATHLKPGEFLAFIVAFQTLLISVLQVSSAIVPVLGIVPEYERIRPILNSLPEADSGKAEPGELTGDIDLNRVTFRYHADQSPVLRNVSLRVKAGEFVALVGESGCGKSTLLRILLGFEQPEAGAVYYDNRALPGLNIAAVRRQIGVVLQSGRLMTGSIFGNIVGSLPLGPDDAWEAARMAGMEEDIKAMPMGMHTMLSEDGGGVSGGQRQRLLIARAVVNRPRILLFDEATSALDNVNQAVISQSLERLKATRIVIAHRLSTVRNADRIIVMRNGEFVESGTYDELIAQNGLFTELAQRQVLD